MQLMRDLKKLKDVTVDESGEMSVCKLIEEDADVNLQVEGDWIAPWEVKHRKDK